MATLKAFIGLVSLSLFATISRAAPVVNQQVVLTSVDAKPLDSEERILRVNTTFDAVELKDSPMETLDSYGYLSFEGYQIFDPKAAAADGRLNRSDVDCAVTKPNALLLLPQKNKAPGIFKSNATALAGRNVSHFFDFISFEIKPLKLNSTWVWAEMNAWTIKDGKAENVQDLQMGFGSNDGTFIPSVLEPRRYIPGWGEKVNFIEFKGEDEDGHPAAFCIDNIVVDYHRPYDDE